MNENKRSLLLAQIEIKSLISCSPFCGFSSFILNDNKKVISPPTTLNIQIPLIVIVLYKNVLATNPINIPMLLNITTLAVADCCSSFEKWPV